MSENKKCSSCPRKTKKLRRCKSETHNKSGKSFCKDCRTKCQSCDSYFCHNCCEEKCVKCNNNTCKNCYISKYNICKTCYSNSQCEFCQFYVNNSLTIDFDNLPHCDCCDDAILCSACIETCNECGYYGCSGCGTVMTCSTCGYDLCNQCIGKCYCKRCNRGYYCEDCLIKGKCEDCR